MSVKKPLTPNVIDVHAYMTIAHALESGLCVIVLRILLFLFSPYALTWPGLSGPHQAGSQPAVSRQLVCKGSGGSDSLPSRAYPRLRLCIRDCLTRPRVCIAAT